METKLKFKYVQNACKEENLIKIDCSDDWWRHDIKPEIFYLNKENEIVAHFENDDWFNVECLSDKNNCIYTLEKGKHDKNNYSYQIIKVNPDKSYTVLHGIEYIELGIADDTFAIKKNGLYGFIDYNGNEIVKPQYEKYCCFRYGLACVKKDDKWGFINKQNETIIPFIYDTPEYEFGAFDIYWGTKINRITDTMFNKHLEVLCAPVAKDGKYGFINDKNETIIPFIYDNAVVFYGNKKNEVFCVKKDDKWGFVDINNNVVLDFEYDAVEGDGNEVSTFIVLKGKKEDKEFLHGLVNHRGELIIPCEYLKLEIAETTIVAKKQNRKWVLLDYKNNEISDEFDMINFYPHDGMYLVENDEKFGYMNLKGEITVPLKYRKSSCYFAGGLAKAGLDDLSVDIIDKKGNVLYHSKSSRKVYNLGNGCILAEKDIYEFEIIKLI